MSALFELTFIPLFVEAILYGLYLATFIHCMRWLVFDDEGPANFREKISWQMLSITLLLFILTTAAIGVNFRLAVSPTLQPGNSRVWYRLDLVLVRVFSDGTYRLRLD